MPVFDVALRFGRSGFGCNVGEAVADGLAVRAAWVGAVACVRTVCCYFPVRHNVLFGRCQDFAADRAMYRCCAVVIISGRCVVIVYDDMYACVRVVLVKYGDFNRFFGGKRCDRLVTVFVAG